jgi:coenzyme F420-reducing hydrogenase delta subunit
MQYDIKAFSSACDTCLVVIIRASDCFFCRFQEMSDELDAFIQQHKAKLAQERQNFQQVVTDNSVVGSS